MGTPRMTTVAGPPVAYHSQTALADAPLRRHLQVTTVGLQVRASVIDHRLCVALGGTRTTQFAVTDLHYGAPAWLAWAGELAVGAAVVASQVAGLAPRSAAGDGLAAAGATLVVAAIVDAALMASAALRPADRVLPAIDVAAVPALVTCGRPLPAETTVTLHSDRGAISAPTDPSGTAVFDAAQWPAAAFPYALPLAKAHCELAEPQPVVLQASAAATLVLARSDLDDMETWLYLHPGDRQRGAVQTARDHLQNRQRAEQRQALAQARQALADEDLALAATAARRCRDASQLPAPACDALLRLVNDRFIERQLALAQTAIRAGHWQAARDAHYRCQLVDRERPGCLQLALAIDAAELAAHRRVAQATADSLADKASDYTRRRKWPWALVLLQRCLELSTADVSRCQQQLAVVQGRISGRQR